MDVRTYALIAIGVAATIFVLFGYYWWEVRPVDIADRRKP
jgi:hypothetical protein